MKRILLAVVFSAVPASAQDLVARPLQDALRQGCGFDGASCTGSSSALAVSGSETESYIEGEIDAASGLSGPLLEQTRKGEGEAIRRMIDKSPELQRMIEDAQSRPRSWGEYYQDRMTDAAVASWGSNLKAGYIKGTAAAYATFKTAPPVVDVVAGGALWVAGVAYGLLLSAVAIVFTGHL